MEGLRVDESVHSGCPMPGWLKTLRQRGGSCQKQWEERRRRGEGGEGCGGEEEEEGDNLAEVCMHRNTQGKVGCEKKKKRERGKRIGNVGMDSHIADSSGITGGVAPTCRKTDDNATLSHLEKKNRISSRLELTNSFCGQHLPTNIWRLHDRTQHNSFPVAIPPCTVHLQQPALVAEPPSALALHQNNLKNNEALAHILKMTENTIGISTSSENQLSGRHLVGGGVFLDVLRPLYLDNMTTQKDSSFVTFSRTQPDFPPVKKVNHLDKKRILVTGVSTLSFLLYFLSFPQIQTQTFPFSPRLPKRPVNI